MIVEEIQELAGNLKAELLAVQDIAGWPVMKAKCATCPFRDGGDMDLRVKIINRTGLSASHICHHATLVGKPETHLCRGARDEQLTILHRLQLIEEPTDAAFTAASRAAGVT